MSIELYSDKSEYHPLPTDRDDDVSLSRYIRLHRVSHFNERIRTIINIDFTISCRAESFGFRFVIVGCSRLRRHFCKGQIDERRGAL
jgi:hypothetical protein